MRITSDFFVSALIRRVFGTGGFAAVVSRGATEAGAVFVLTRGRLGRVTLYGPAAQASYDQAQPDERRFALLLDEADDAEVDQRLARERRFDSDIWVVELEPGSEPVTALLALAEG